MAIQVETFFDHDTYTLTYVVYDQNTKDTVIIDPVYDYNPATSTLSEESINHLLYFIEAKNLNIHYILETHAHADHITSSAKLKHLIPGAKVAIGSQITQVQKVFKDVFNDQNMKVDGSQFDLLLEDNQVIEAGSVHIKTMTTPGHTPACCSFIIEDRVFTGDALFMPDSGTGRCDFPAGSAEDLYHSVQEKLYKLPDETRVYVGHDYQPNNRKMLFETSIAMSKKENIQLKQTTEKEAYVAFRTTRDAKLSAPRLLLPSIQLNIKAGELPSAEDNGVGYIKLPLKVKE